MPVKRMLAAALAAVTLTAAALAQSPLNRPGVGGPRWRTPEKPASSSPRAAESETESPLRAVSDRRVIRVANSIGSLPDEHGQLWREYDISPYTRRVTSTKRPERAVIDWILRETGYETWHSETVAVLSADKNRLRVYHTPETQQVVAEMVERFTSSENDSHAFSLRVMTIDNPNWRARAHRVLRPIPVQSQGIQAWLLQKEEAALLMSELSKRSDFREHSAPNVLVGNGQSYVLSRTRAKNYMQNVHLRPGAWPGFEAQPGQIDEGLSLEFSPLVTVDGANVDAVIKCHIDQVERLLPVVVEVPTSVAPRQRTKIEVPQVSQCRVQERFRWPVEQVLLIGFGMTPTPHPAEARRLRLGLSPPPPPRTDVLVMIECKGRHATTPVAKTVRRRRGTNRPEIR